VTTTTLDPADLAAIEHFREATATYAAELHAATPLLDRLSDGDYPGAVDVYAQYQTGADPDLLLPHLDGLLRAKGDLGAWSYWSWREHLGLSHVDTIKRIAESDDEALAPGGELEAYLAFAAKH